MSRLLDPVRAELEGARSSLFAVVDGVSDDVFAAQPAPGKWSVAEILHHLVGIEGQITMLLQSFVARAPVLTSFFDIGAVAASLDPFKREEVVRPIQSPSVPETGHSREDLLFALRSTRAAFLEVLDHAEPLDLRSFGYKHPIIGDLNAYQWMVFVPRHERRHTGQIQRVLATVNA